VAGFRLGAGELGPGLPGQDFDAASGHEWVFVGLADAVGGAGEVIRPVGPGFRCAVPVVPQPVCFGYFQDPDEAVFGEARAIGGELAPRLDLLAVPAGFLAFPAAFEIADDIAGAAG
jgi:hypothetical protein